MDIHLQSFAIPRFPSLMFAMSKPAYLAIREMSPTKPVILFVPSRKQCGLTANDLLLHCLADGNENRKLNIEEANLQPHLDHISDPNVAENLKHGVGIYHEALSKQDKRIVERLFKSGAIQVLIASRVSFFCCTLHFFEHSYSGHCLELAHSVLHGDNNGCTILRRKRTSIH